jgi:putative DNA methylase
MDRYCRRLIEVDLPIRRVSRHARREKSIRHGHLSTLHIWWARRPLAACRAVLCAALWPDPLDELCPDVFRHDAKGYMLRWACDHAGLASGESLKRLVAVEKDAQLLDSNQELRAVLLDFIADFADWDNSANTAYLQVARAITQSAHEALGGAAGSRPLVADPFAGGGAIPLEITRLGAEAFASDLNPVAALLNQIVVEYIPKHGQPLADAVRHWGGWIETKLQERVGRYYPADPNGATPIAYLWARTILSEAPGEADVPVEVPLLQSMWLTKTAGRPRALRWVRDSSGRVKTEATEITCADGVRRKMRRPLLEVFSPTKASEVEEATSSGGAATCPVTGFTMAVDSVRLQLGRRRGGAGDARLVCVVTSSPHAAGRSYRVPAAQDLNAMDMARSMLRERIQSHDSGGLSLIPDEELNHLRGFFNVVLYGMTTWGDLFNPRQLLVLVTLCDLIKELKTQSIEDDLFPAVQTCLALVIGRMADGNSSLTRWGTTREQINNTFGRQALPMVWDYAEANPVGRATRSLDGMIGWIVKVIEHETTGGGTGTVAAVSATDHVLPDDAVDAIFTDPPYYAAVPYADLSDFFYVWYRRSLGESSHAGMFSSALTPKGDEIVSLAHRAAMYRQKNNRWFEEGMGRACSEARRIVRPSGVGVFVFASKETAAWEAMLAALIGAGWTVTASWPIDTEMGSRLRAQNSAALASSIHLFCRPRENPDGSLRMDDVGDWRDVLAELPVKVHDWMPRLAAEGIVGADAIFSCLGPALEIFSRHSSVEKASGENVTLAEYLEEVWAAVSREALGMIFEDADASGFEEDARLTAMWLWTMHTSPNEGEPGDQVGETKAVRGYGLEYDAARKIAQGLGAHLENLSHLVEVKGNAATLLTAGARTKYLFGKDGSDVPARRKKKQEQMTLDFVQEIDELEEQSGDWAMDPAASPGKTVLDQLHQAMILFGASRGEALRRFLVEDGIGGNGHFWRLAQALSALYPASTDEKRWVDGVLARKKGLGL